MHCADDERDTTRTRRSGREEYNVEICGETKTSEDDNMPAIYLHLPGGRLTVL